MGKEFLIRTLIALLGEYLLNPASARPYVKYLIRGRDYLNLLVPASVYPSDGLGSTLADRDPADFAIPAPERETPAPAAGGKRGGK